MIKSKSALPQKLPAPVKHHIHHLERMRSDFVANVSHELRTPLTVIQGYLEWLIQQPDYQNGDQLKSVFQQMYQNGLRMKSLIDDLLLLAHLESEDYPSEETPRIAVSKLLENICDEAKKISGDKQHQFILKINKYLRLDGSITELKSLFSNLIVNAVKYTPPHGTITIEWYSQNGRANFAVSDTGIGIAKKHLPRITERFYRVDKGRSRASGGTGLGLAIAKHILLRHQAELKIESTLNKGSRFISIFPETRSFEDAH